MDKTIIRKINEEHQLIRLRLGGDTQPLSDYLNLLKTERISNATQAAQLFSNVLDKEIAEEDVYRLIPSVKFAPGPNWQLYNCFLVPFENSGWLFIFEGGNQLGFLDNQLFELKDLKIQSLSKESGSYLLALIITMAAIALFLASFYCFRR